MVFVLNLVEFLGDLVSEEVKNLRGVLVAEGGPGTASVDDEVGDLVHRLITNTAFETFDRLSSVESVVDSLDNGQRFFFG